MKPILEAKKTQVVVHDRELPILFETNLSISKGDFVVILGHNGSGKSTLVKTLSGIRPPTFGSVSVDGANIFEIPSKILARDVITITQKPDDRLFTELTLEENILLWESRFSINDRFTPEQVMQMSDNSNRLLPLLKQKIGDFSGGERQSILLTLALVHPPKVLFLDEHTSSLDPKAAENIMKTTAKAIADQNITSLMVTHKLDDALLYGNRLIIMREGYVVFDERKTGDLSIKKLRDIME